MSERQQGIPRAELRRGFTRHWPTRQSRNTFVPYNHDMSILTTTTKTTDDVVQAAATAALRRCADAVNELGRALAELREALPGDLRADGERAFMNAFGNAVWAEGHAANS